MLSRRENALIAYRHGQPPLMPCIFTDFSIFMADPALERYTGVTKGNDAWGVEWVFDTLSKAAMPTPGKYLLGDVTDWREVVRFPDLDAIDWEKQADIDMRTDFLKFSTGAGIVPFEDGHSIKDIDSLKFCLVLVGMFERLHALMGMEEAMVALVTEPEACYDFFGAVADWKIAYFRKIKQYYPADVINAHDDYASAKGLFMSPGTWRDLIKPHLKRMVDACHEMGLIYEHHSCGNIEPLLDDLVEIGVDAIDPLQADCNPHLAGFKERLGDRLTFCGAFDNIRILDDPESTPDQIKAEYRRVIDSLAPGGSYVCYPVTLTHQYVPHFLEEHFAYGLNFYQKT